MNIPDRAPGQVRIGVAIAIPEPIAGQLQEARASFGDASSWDIPPHITLLVPTAIAVEAIDEVHDHLVMAAATSGPFRIHLRGSASFRPVSPVVFVQVVEGIAECEQLERAVRSGPLDQELRFNYHPHVTVAHDVAEAGLDRAFAEMATFDAVFRATRIDLFEHGNDGVWRPQRQYELTGARASAI